MMHQNIRKNILSLVDFTEGEIITFLSHMEEKTLKQYDFHLKEGAFCRDVAFINKGLFRTFYIKDGKEHITAFFSEGEWVTDYTGFLLRKPSLFFTEALQDSELFILTFDNMQKLYGHGKQFERFGRLIAEKIFLQLSQRNISLILDTPEERYITLMQDKPKLFELLPLRYIASYIGVEPESLSRIRKRVSTNRS